MWNSRNPDLKSKLPISSWVVGQSPAMPKHQCGLVRAVVSAKPKLSAPTICLSAEPRRQRLVIIAFIGMIVLSCRNIELGLIARSRDELDVAVLDVVAKVGSHVSA